MVASLHLVQRATAELPHEQYYDLLELADTRVLELFDAQRTVPTIDLTLAERDMPEVVAAIHWADEIHVHGIHPELVLRVLPVVRDDVLRTKTLVFHGGWAPIPAIRDLHVTRLQQWPGSARHDGRGTPEDIAARVLGNVELELPVEFVDPHRASVVPRACGPAPIPLPDGRSLATVNLSASLEENVRRTLQDLLPRLGSTTLVVQVADETDTPAAERAEARRAAQGFISPGVISHEFLEACLQGVPMLALAAAESLELPEDITRVDAGDLLEDAVRNTVGSWSTWWTKGEAAPTDTDARNTFASRYLR